jgi:hypothetical protein
MSSLSTIAGKAPETGANEMDGESRLRQIMSWVAVGLVTCMAIFFFGLIGRRGMEEHAWLKVTQDHFAAVVGLPASAVGRYFWSWYSEWQTDLSNLKLVPLSSRALRLPLSFGSFVS